MSNITSPETVSDILPYARRVASDAEERARVLREYVDLLEAAEPAAIDRHIAEQFAGPGWVRDFLDRIEAATHIHSGSTDASNVRLLTSGVLTLLARLQRGA